MHIDLPVTTALEYARETGDLDAEGEPTYDIRQYELLQIIISLELAVYLLRRSTGGCGSNSDSLKDIRKTYIKIYEREYGEYQLFNTQYES